MNENKRILFTPGVTNQALPVFVVDDHNDVLPCLHRLMGSKRIPLQHLTLLHFDSHSDLSVPVGLQVDQIFKKDELYRVTSTDNYYLSELSHSCKKCMINTKRIDVHVVTLGTSSLCDCKSRCNPPEGVSSLNADVEAVNAVSDNQNVPETTQKGAYESLPKLTTSLQSGCEVHDNNVHSAKELSLSRKRTQIDTLPDADVARDVEAAASMLADALKKNDTAAGFVLDIDLDFFSTADPFRSTLNAEQQRLMSELYCFTPPCDESYESVCECIQHREEQLSYLQKVMTSMQSGDVPYFTDSNRDRMLSQLLDSIATPSCESTSGAVKLNPSFDYEWLHEIGTGIDDCPLPHHISSDAEIQRLLMRVEGLLKNLPRPCALTIARSSSDGYCPEHQVDAIQTAVIVMLERIYGALDVNLQYIDS